MELGEFVFLAKGDLRGWCVATSDLELHVKGRNRAVVAQLLRRQQDGAMPQVLATIDRQLTNRDEKLRQNYGKVPDAAGQVLSVAAAGLGDLQVVSVTTAAPYVLVVRVIVRLLPAAFDVVVPEQTSRAAVILGGSAVATAAAASTATAVLNVVELLRERSEHLPGDCHDPEGSDGVVEVDFPLEGTSMPEGPDTVACAGPDSPSFGRTLRKRAAVQSAAANVAVGNGCGRHDRANDTPVVEELVEANRQEDRSGERRPAYTDVRDEVFDIVAPRDWHTAHPNPPDLKCKLFPYQQRALSWMVWRETQPELGTSLNVGAATFQQDADGGVAVEATAAATAHLGDFASQDLFWQRVEVYGGQELWVNPYPGGGIRRDPPLPPRRQRVGILADEMGLGKTVEVIALMLARPPMWTKQEHEKAKDGCRGPAATGASCQKMGANLIVTPPSILQQWAHEIKTHSNLKVCVYDGLRWHRQHLEERNKERLKEAKRQERLALEHEMEVKRQERARQKAEREAARMAKHQAFMERKRARMNRLELQPHPDEAAGAHVSRYRNVRRRGGNGGRIVESEHTTDNDETDVSEHWDQDMGVGALDKGPHSYGGGNTAGPSTSTGALSTASLEGRHRRRYTGQPPIGQGAPAAPAAAASASAAERNRGTSQAANGVMKTLRKRPRVSFAPGTKSSDTGAVCHPEAVSAGASSRPFDDLALGAPSEVAAAAAAGQDLIHSCLSAPVESSSGGGRCSIQAAVPSRMQLVNREIMATLYAGTPMCPASCDPKAEASEAVRELLEADVVLTTYMVLREEVHYSPSNRVLSGLRHDKKYAVPESPLLQVHWQRLVMDEAQMMGGSFSNVVQMATRIRATCRWCVTGTPIGGGGLEDILGLLSVLKYSPYDDPAVFRQYISQPYRSGSAEAYSRLASLMKPIMWRNSKAVAAHDHPLPRRLLQEAHLRFSTAEQTFYDVILTETRKAFNEMNNHRQLQAMQQLQQQMLWNSIAGQSTSSAIDLTVNSNDQHQNKLMANAGTGAGTSYSGHTSSSALAVIKHQSQGKRRRGQDRGEALAQVAGAELHQLRLACVHVQLTRYWQKLGRELSLHHSNQVGGGAGAGTPPAIDEVMARLRDQAQLRLQSTERDLCMALNALASRLEATAKKVKDMVAKRALQEATSPGSAAKHAAAATAADDTDVEDGEDDKAVPWTPPYTGKRKGNKMARNKGAETDKGAGRSSHVDGVGAQAEVAGKTHTGAAGGDDVERAVSAFRYVAAAKTAAALSADMERMLSECCELLEYAWNVGENGIDAAAAAAAAAGGEGALDNDIKAATTSIRSWRFVQAHTSQMLADLLSAHPQVYLATARAAASEGDAGVSDAAAAATAASLRAAELRSYVASRVTDVRATADRDLQRAQERVDKHNATIVRLQRQVVEEFEVAVEHGLPAHTIPEPCTWLEDIQGRLNAARQVEADRRTEQQAAAETGATLVLMGREVVDLLASEEAVIQRLRVGLEAAAGSILVVSAVERLRAVDRGLRVETWMPLKPGQDWTSVVVGGVTMLLPPEGLTNLARDPRIAACGEWFLSYPPAVGLLRRTVLHCTSVEAAEMAARGLAHGFDQMTVLLCERHLRSPIRMLDSRLQEQRKTAADRETNKLQGRGLAMLLPAVEAVRLRIELLRAWREHNTAELLVEVADNQCTVVTNEVMEAAQGNVPGMSQLLRLSEEELRNQIAQLKSRCEDVRHKKAFFHNQYLEASRLRNGGSSNAVPAAVAAVPSAGAAALLSSGAAERRRSPAQDGCATSRNAPTHGTVVDLEPLATSVVREARTAGSDVTISTGDDNAIGSTGGHGQTRRTTAAVEEVSDLRGSRTAHVGVACRTGILVCLHPWEQWRQKQDSHHSSGAASRRFVGQEAQPTVDLTAGNAMVEAAAVVARQRDSAQDSDSSDSAACLAAATTAATNGAEAIGTKITEQSSNAGAMSISPATQIGAVERQQLPPGRDHRDNENSQPSPPAEVTTAAAGAEAGFTPEASAGHTLPVSQAADATHRDPRAAAAVAAAKLRIAAESASAWSRLGLGLGSVNGGLDAGASSPTEAAVEEDGVMTCDVCACRLLDDVRLFPCGHYFCASCSKTILGPIGDRRCPTCRLGIRDKDSVVKVAVAGAAGAAGAASGNGAGSLRRRLVEEEVDPPEGLHILDVQVEGASELMCKISALMRRLVWLRDQRPAEKSLVFSQWSDALEIVKRGLKTNGIGYVMLETGRKMRSAVSAFLTDDACRVFLLSLRQGAAGLTLVRANHVFLLEPALDPAIEQQAVARVHRIGQTRDVTVTRLLVDGTVEEAVMRMLKEKQELFIEAATGSGAGPSTSGPRRAGGSGGRGVANHGSGGGGGPSLVPCAVPLLEGGEGEEASLPTAAPRQEVLMGADMSYLLNAVLL